MTQRPIPDQGVLKEADAFLQASQMLNDFSESIMSVPTIVNAAFSLELYLKSLNMEWQLQNQSSLGGSKSFLKSRSAVQTGHQPSKLYRAIDNTTRNTLERHYLQRFQGTNVLKLEEILKAYDGIFQNWRYIFEGHCESVDISALISLLKFFSEEIHALPQRWA
jgi:hypothetical protein